MSILIWYFGTHEFDNKSFSNKKINGSTTYFHHIIPSIFFTFLFPEDETVPTPARTMKSLDKSDSETGSASAAASPLATAPRQSRGWCKDSYGVFCMIYNAFNGNEEKVDFTSLILF